MKIHACGISVAIDGMKTLGIKGKLKDVNTQLGATLNKFVTEYDIKDVLIKEPEISEIVYNIYEGKVELKK